MKDLNKCKWFFKAFGVWCERLGQLSLLEKGRDSLPCPLGV